MLKISTLSSTRCLLDNGCPVFHNSHNTFDSFYFWNCILLVDELTLGYFEMSKYMRYVSCKHIFVFSNDASTWSNVWINDIQVPTLCLSVPTLSICSNSVYLFQLSVYLFQLSVPTICLSVNICFNIRTTMRCIHFRPNSHVNIDN